MLIFERSRNGRSAYSLPPMDVPESVLDMEPHLIRKVEPGLPEVSELQIVRHYTELSRKNYAVDVGFYPLGSCTMKYNPKLNDALAESEDLSFLHPYQDEADLQGALELMYNLQNMLCEITGMDAFSLQPAAGAHGELTGMLIIRKYHKVNGNTHKKKILIPDSAHGTNPASAAMVGFEVVEIKSDSEGLVDVEELKKHLDENVAGIMLTNPNTLGLFEKNVSEVVQLVHEAGGLAYYDGANLNAIMGIAKPGEMGFDIVHLNLHKTFSTPHGMGGPGSGPVGVKKFLEEYLPVPLIQEGEGGSYTFKYDLKHSIGKVRSFYGNFSVLVRAYAYIMSMGAEGLKKVSEMAVLNANYLRKRLSERFKVAYERICMHEFVLDNYPVWKNLGVKTLDMAKRLLDLGFHAPTIYFPLIVKEAMMIEPTETESKEELDRFAEAMFRILEEAEKEPDILREAPKTTPVSRLDEAKASRHPVVRWRKEEERGS
ncbi:MAG: glycine dehydrogenase subunit 2 [Thermotogota bacterium]|nr:glycine dehydrogenase subunit 2 [Thermotogota bacterium]MDK2864738.1 glycine dehydrogenase subunit 2 [Thermotogota bacterium]HCZ06473.1 aminomethyl-transferring glycine dehydrogenase subunit GcvPB [Thermotogota bacterium]